MPLLRGRIMVPQRCLHPNLGIYKYVTLYNKGDFSDVINIKDPTIMRLSWNSSWDQSNHMNP